MFLFFPSMQNVTSMPIFATFGFLAPFGGHFTIFGSTPVCSTYLVHVTDVLSNVSKMEESLRKLKKVR
jgi:hypothetical protein